MSYSLNIVLCGTELKKIIDVLRSYEVTVGYIIMIVNK